MGCLEPSVHGIHRRIDGNRSFVLPVTGDASRATAGRPSGRGELDGISGTSEPRAGGSGAGCDSVARATTQAPGLTNPKVTGLLKFSKSADRLVCEECGPNGLHSFAHGCSFFKAAAWDR